MFILVPRTPNCMFDTSNNISPSDAFAIDPDSIIISPFSVLPLNFFLTSEFSNSLTLKELNSFIITVVLSLYCIVNTDCSDTNISSFKKIGSKTANSFSSPS